MKAKTVVIGLLADRIDILDCQGSRVSSCRRVSVKLDANPAEWAKSMRGATNALRDAIQGMGLTGRGAIVLYRSPTETADYVSVKIPGAAQAREAALLGCGDKLGFPLDQAVTEAVVIGRDATAPNAGERQTHIVIAADKDEHATAIANMVTEAGLRFVSATPIDAAVMAHLGSAAINADTEQPPPPGGRGHAMLYIGERRSFFLIVNNGALVFARPVGLGIEAMVTSLTRPLRSFDGSTPVELDVDSARTILHRYGFPKREEIVHEQLKVTGGQIIPLLQPVLQRFVVELRQSLRFGLPEEERQSVALRFTGPGSSIPGFAAIVSTELAMKVEVDPKYAGFDGVQVGAQGSELLDAVADAGLVRRLSLPPRAIAMRISASRLRRWLWTGAAVALAFVCTDSLHYGARLSNLRKEADSQTSRADEMLAMQVAGRRLMDAIGAMTTTQTIMEIELGAAVNYRACLTELTRLTPASVRLDNVRFQIVDGKSTGLISGCAFVEDSSGKLTQLESFIGSLRESPLFEDVALHNVHVATIQNRNAQTFEVKLASVAAPTNALSSMNAMASDALEGGSR